MKTKDKEILLGGAGFQKELQSLSTAPKVESTSSKLVQKSETTSKDVMFLLR